MQPTVVQFILTEEGGRESLCVHIVHMTKSYSNNKCHHETQTLRRENSQSLLIWWNKLQLACDSCVTEAD